jgi:hypothetical protein
METPKLFCKSRMTLSNCNCATVSKGAHVCSSQIEHVPLYSGLSFGRLCLSGVSNGNTVARLLTSSRQSAWLVAGITRNLDPCEHESTTSSILSGSETPSEHIGFSLNSPPTLRRRPTTSRDNSEFRSVSGMWQSVISFSSLPPLLSCMQGGPCPTRQMLSI